MKPIAILRIHLERLDDVIEWQVYSPKALADLRRSVAAGEFGPARILEDSEQESLAA